MDDGNFDLGRFIIDFDPTVPRLSSAFGIVGVSLESALPKPVPWPNDQAPVGMPLKEPISDQDDLSKFHGYDAIIVTWTAAEASALAAMFSPGYPTSSWYNYRHGIEKYVPMVTGHKAPFNDHAHDMAKYYHSLGLYFPCRIGNAKVLLFKSGLHMAYDGPATPVFNLMCELMLVVKPKIFITTGTGGGIGADVSLGDVIIASKVKFNCKQQFAKESWAKDTYTTSKMPTGSLSALTPALTSINASRISGARPHPKFFSADSSIVTTDFFAYDDTTNHFELQGLGQCCDMGDAMVARAWAGRDDIKFYAIRNASDPQIPNPTKDMAIAGKAAASIYARYGGLTTAASVLACWAIIQGDQ